MHASSRSLIVAGVLLAAVPAVGHAAEYFLVGAGVDQFGKSAMKDAFDTGFSWRAALGVGNRRQLGGEAAYVGAFHSGKAGGPDLLSNGVEGIIRLQYPYGGEGSAALVEPFVFAGIGWSYVTLRNAPALLTNTSDNIGTVPFGAGITFGLSRLLLDVRFTYRATFSDDLTAGSGGNAGLQTWDVGASVGWEF